MNNPNSAIPEEATPAVWRRYEEWRGRRHQEFNSKYSHWLVSWRTRRTFRRLVLLQAFFSTLLVISSVFAFLNTGWFLIPFAVGLVGLLTTLSLLRIVTGSIADTPVTALDEIQVAQRNSARAIGFVVLYSLMFIPYAVLIVLSFRDEVPGQWVYGCAILLITLVVAAISVPTMLIAWWMADPDPEDLEAMRKPSAIDDHPTITDNQESAP